MPAGLNLDNVKYWLKTNNTPVTVALIAYTLLMFVFSAFGVTGRIYSLLVLDTSTVAARWWTLLSYPLVVSGASMLCLLFLLIWLWFAGGSLERGWGWRRYGWFMLANVCISALGITLGAFIAGKVVLLAGLWLPLAGLTMAFAAINPEQTVLVMFVIPLKLKYLAVFSAFSVLIGFASYGFIVAVFALVGCAFCLWYATGASLHKLRESRPDNVVRVYPRKSKASKPNPIKSAKERKEQQRLKEFFERSGIDEE